MESVEYAAVMARNDSLLPPNDPNKILIATDFEEEAAEAQSAYRAFLPTLPSNSVTLSNTKACHIFG